MRLIYAVLLVSVLGGPAAAASVDIAIGGRFWYNWWRPPWADGVLYATPAAPARLVSLPYRVDRFRINPAPMYGFFVSALFLEHWFFSSSVMFSQYDTNSETPRYAPLFSLPELKNRMEIKRYDFDARLGYKANRYFTVFLHFKTRAFDYARWTRLVDPAAVHAYLGRSESELIDVGPGIGMAVFVPLYGGLFMEGAVSGLVYAGYGTQTYNYQYDFLAPGVSLILDRFDRENFYSYSGSGSLSLGYRIEPANIVIRLGGRYEVSRYVHHRIPRGFLDLNEKFDQSWGTTFSVAYAVTVSDSQ